MPFHKSKAPEDSESPEINTTIEADPGADDESVSGSDAEEEAPATATAAAAASESGPSKKKKKKRSKIARAISAMKGDSVPQAVVDQVVAKVKEEHGEDSPAADEETVRDLLKQLKLKDVVEGKAGFGGKNRKDTGDHKVCCSCSECIRYLSGIDVVRWRSSGRRNPYHTSVRHIYPICELCSSILA
jgi:glycylpeptide N-tetradecanoyltransferase